LALFSGSSRQRNQRNADGSQNVYCYLCNEFICVTFSNFQRALCELCRRIEEGEILTPEAVQQYKLSKGDKTDVSMLLLPVNEPTAKKFTLRSLTGEILQAVGLKKPEAKKLKSVEVAEQKKRGRLFSQVDLGSMDTLDTELRKKTDETR
jgi:hypothetical protein